MTTPTYSIRDAAWIIADYLAPEPSDHAARRAAADKARKRVIYAAARPDALFAIVAGTIERDGFLRWAALTYPGYRPPLDQMKPITGTGASSAGAVVSAVGFTLAPPPDDDMKAAWFDAERRAFELQRKLDDVQRKLDEAQKELRKLSDDDARRRAVNRANARKPRNR